jgi:hypothetical protein
MFSHGQPRGNYYPTFNENRPPSLQHYRPQTPQGHSYTGMPQQPLNRTYSKIPSQGYGYAPQRNNLSRSKVSLASSQASQLGGLIN